MNLAAGILPDPDGFVAGVASLIAPRLSLSPKLRASLARWTARLEKSSEGEIDLEAFAADGRVIASVIMRTAGFRPV